jgi:predicted acetyltransferase
MLKLVDLKDALQRRPYDPAVRGEVILKVKGDDTSPWNDGAWRVVWRDGQATVSKSTKPSGRIPTARIDIQSLAVLYSGRRSASQLAELDSIRGPADALRLLDAAFPMRVPYLQEWF